MQMFASDYFLRFYFFLGWILKIIPVYESQTNPDWSVAGTGLLVSLIQLKNGDDGTNQLSLRNRGRDLVVTVASTYQQEAS